ncbi:MAG: CotH kinase family protein, partial [Phycisphaerae bacterium]
TFDITLATSDDFDLMRFACPAGDCGGPPHSLFQAQLTVTLADSSTIGPILVGVRRQSDLAEPDEVNPQKFSLKIDINEFAPGQTLFGKKKFSLENGSEKALVTEGMSWVTYQSTGAFVSSQAAWVNVIIDGDLKGLFANVEQVDKTFLTDHGIDNGGFLYKETVAGEDQRTRELETNPFLFNWYPFDHPTDPLNPEVAAPADWRDQAVVRVDMPNLMALAAAENYIANPDGVVNKMNNYFYYDWSILPLDDPAGQQPRLYFPWDVDTAWKQALTDQTVLDSAVQGQLQDGLIEEKDEAGVPFGLPTFQADYFSAYRNLLNGPLAQSQLVALIDSVEVVIATAIDNDPYTNLIEGGAVPAAVEFQRLRDWAAARTASVVSQLNSLGVGFTLTTFASGNGSITRSPDLATIYDSGEVVTLTAVPDSGYVFVFWGGDASGTVNPTNVTMSQNRSVTAFFAPVGQTVTLYDFSVNAGVDRFAFGTFTDSWAADLEGIRQQCPELCTLVTTVDAAAYTKLAVSDAFGGDADPNRYVNPDEAAQDESTLLVEFNIAETPSAVLSIDARWEGYGDGTHHMELYIWNYVQNNWGDGAGLFGENNFMADGAADVDLSLNGLVTTNVSDYISPTGEISLLIYDDAASEDSFHDYVCILVFTSTALTGDPGDQEAADSDGDRTPDVIDGCPNDPNKTVPGQCGCGIADTDSDGDGTADCLDGCPGDANKTAPGDCGCGIADIDSDGDGAADCLDACPTDPNKTTPGACGCGVADIDADGDGTPDCGGLPVTSTILDADLDGIPDACDNCPNTPNTDQADCDTNGLGDVCAIASGFSLDCNANGLPDDCEFPGCPGLILGDMDCSGVGDGADLQGFVDVYITLRYSCQADMDQNGDVNAADLSLLVTSLLGG